MSLSIHSCSTSKGQVAHEGLGFATLGPAKPKPGLEHHWSQDFCVQSNTAGLELWRYLDNDMSCGSPAGMKCRSAGGSLGPCKTPARSKGTLGRAWADAACRARGTVSLLRLAGQPDC